MYSTQYNTILKEIHRANTSTKYSNMGSGVPLLNDYKLDFFWKRFPQTVLGGPKIKLGYTAPPYVYLNQIILFLFPLFLGIIFTVLAEFDLLEDEICLYVYGALMVLFVIIVQCISRGIQRKHNSVTPIDAIKSKFNTTDEEDEIEFMSCCGTETLEFTIPGKKFIFNVIFHAILSGPLCALGMWYLLPTTLKGLFANNIAATVILYVLGWITICIAQYSLTVSNATETAVFKSVDPYEISALMRPFYLFVFFSFDLTARYHDQFVSVNYYLHILFVFLPLMWTAGILPPLHALFLWGFEQTLVIFLGGSPMASDLRLVLMLLVSCGVFLVVYFIPQGIQTVILMSGFGYILSTDQGSLCTQMLRCCCQNITDPVHSIKGFLWHWKLKEVFFHLAMLSVAIGVSAAVNYLCVVSNSLEYTDYIGYGVISLLVIEAILADIQSVYVLFGLWRNKLYPKSVQRSKIFNKQKKYLKAMGIIRRICIDFLCPVVILAYVSMSVKFPMELDIQSSNNTNNSAMDVLGTARVFRWTWQSTQNCLLELSIAHILKLALPAASAWSSMSIGVQLLVISFARDRVSQIIDKLYFFWATLVTSWTVKKQRRKSSAGLIALNLILFPLVFAVICLAAALSAPLLTLFTLPIFLIGFPRPLRSWPEKVGGSANKCPDTVFYEQATPELALALRSTFASGSIGEPSPGKHYLLRFQDRMAWVQVLERGYCYCSISIKGLELQETSCHTVEATRIDDILEFTFEQENGVSCCLWNKYAFNTLRPYDAAYVKTLSDAKNQLTGVIDSPEVLQSVVSNFRKALVWNVLRHVHKVSRAESNVSHDSDGVAVSDGLDQRAHEDKQDAQPQRDDYESNLPPVTPKQKQVPARKSSIKSFSNSVWSDDDSLFAEVLGEQPTKGDMSAPKGGSSKPEPKFVSKTSPTRKNLIFDDDDDDDPFTPFNMPPSKAPLQPMPPLGKGAVNKGPNANTINSSLFTSTHSTLLSLPPTWHDNSVDVLKLNGEEKEFPTEWYKHVVAGLKFEESDGKGPNDIAIEVSSDKILAKMYSHFVGACHLIINSLGLSGADPVSLGPKHLLKIYNGDIPWSVAADWLTGDEVLKQLVVKSYRYSVKLSMDEMLLGPVSSDEEMSEYMTEYDSDWYMGNEADPQWTEAIQGGVPQLFALSYDKNKKTYNSRVLTSQDTAVYISSLNPEAVRGQWANLNLELFYMTNDDEERYSIQAHPSLLRNLTVQAADPPLGYPIYASPPIPVPTL